MRRISRHTEPSDAVGGVAGQGPLLACLAFWQAGPCMRRCVAASLRGRAVDRWTHQCTRPLLAAATLSTTAGGAGGLATSCSSLPGLSAFLPRAARSPSRAAFQRSFARPVRPKLTENLFPGRAPPAATARPALLALPACTRCPASFGYNASRLSLLGGPPQASVLKPKPLRRPRASKAVGPESV